jgi:glutamate dehydrogenase (NAD(P)+)
MLLCIRLAGFSPAVVTGKPLSLHGSHGKEQAAGRGVAIAGREFLNHVMQQPVKNTSVIVQVRCLTAAGGVAVNSREGS